MLAPMAPRGGGQSKAGGAEGAGRANSRRRQRAVRLLGAAALGCATLAALALPPRGNPRVDSAARSYWGPGAPAWWSRFPVAAGAASAAQRRLQAKALGSERQRRLQTGLGQQHEQQQHAAAPPALLGNRAAQTGNGTATAKSISAARVADRWLHARPSSGAAGHWEWIPASRSHLAPGLYHASDRDAMPFRNGVYTHQHAWDTDGLRKQWDTGDSARAYVCLGVRASVCVYVCVCVCVLPFVSASFFGPTFTTCILIFGPAFSPLHLAIPAPALCSFCALSSSCFSPRDTSSFHISLVLPPPLAHRQFCGFCRRISCSKWTLLWMR